MKKNMTSFGQSTACWQSLIKYVTTDSPAGFTESHICMCHILTACLPCSQTCDCIHLLRGDRLKGTHGTGPFR